MTEPLNTHTGTHTNKEITFFLERFGGQRGSEEEEEHSFQPSSSKEEA